MYSNLRAANESADSVAAKVHSNQSAADSKSRYLHLDFNGAHKQLGTASGPTHNRVNFRQRFFGHQYAPATDTQMNRLIWEFSAFSI